ncbi:UROD/MetE-like protein [Xylona heveae TC161]|uniref:UROD/MetE-like protein n=1 Tax=Xylona heveae (strain CBS 132557 / TC161) TaxID=1328760 RepID=A0A164ZWR5_XYLHT|nr:UROD/MetE-like protein [Xylona heveae TC161]KZF19631.1 UROD/MetE-like protein [Xylona heveae TC161]
MSLKANLRRKSPFRAEHVGSLLRPDDLLKARQALEEGKLSQDELYGLEDVAVKEIVELQLSLGLHAISDGEYKRFLVWGSLFPGLEGFEQVKNPPWEISRDYMPDVAPFADSEIHETLLCTGKIKHVGSTYLREWDYLRSIVSAKRLHECKITLPAPEWYHMRYREGRAYPKEVYSNDDQYFADIASAYQNELQTLYEHGARNIQFDDPNLASLLDVYIALYNSCISKRPADMHVGVHICRGNFIGGRHFSEGGYDRVAKKLFQTMNVDTFYLEYDTPRAGGFEPLAALPKDKNVILGVISSKLPQLEDPEKMKERVWQAADIIAEGNSETRSKALGRMGVSPQSGFASIALGNDIDKEAMIKKLKSVREVANLIWPGEP